MLDSKGWGRDTWPALEKICVNPPAELNMIAKHNDTFEIDPDCGCSVNVDLKMGNMGCHFKLEKLHQSIRIKCNLGTNLLSIRLMGGICCNVAKYHIAIIRFPDKFEPRISRLQPFLNSQTAAILNLEVPLTWCRFLYITWVSSLAQKSTERALAEMTAPAT